MASDYASVIIIEDDLFASDFMEMLLIRDWRARVICAIQSIEELKKCLSKSLPTNEEIVVLIDTEVPDRPDWLITIAQLIKSRLPNCKILCTGTTPQLDTLKQIFSINGQGYIIKNEVGYGLGAAIRYVTQGEWVTTPSVEAFARRNAIVLPKKNIVITQNTVNLEELTQQERQFAKLCILFGVAHREIADDFTLEPNTVRRKLSKVYHKLYFWEILDSTDAEFEKLFESKRVIDLFKAARNEYRYKKGHTKKDKPAISNQATLAFHLLTCVKEIARYI